MFLHVPSQDDAVKKQHFFDLTQQMEFFCYFDFWHEGTLLSEQWGKGGVLCSGFSLSQDNTKSKRPNQGVLLIMHSLPGSSD